MEEVVIVGGGIAGLSCMNALLDKYISPLLLEASTIGSPKICGEFLAPPAIEQLQEWGIGPMQTIKQARFNDVEFSFPDEAAAYSRCDAEFELASRATKFGGRIVEQTPIKKIIPATPSSPFILHLSSGEILHARHVIFATGKFSQPITNSIYIGFKTHIRQVIEPETLLMFSLAGGYFGIVPVSSEMSNLTCLIKREMIEKAGSCRSFFDCLVRKYIDPSLRWDGSMYLRESWLEGPAPTFGAKSLPPWPHAYWIGDAFASIHPAIGYGFAHSVSSALLAVDYYLQNDPTGYHQELSRLMRPKCIIGKYMHHLLQKPRLCKVVSSLFGSTWLSHQLLKTLDY